MPTLTEIEIHKTLWKRQCNRFSAWICIFSPFSYDFQGIYRYYHGCNDV